MVRAKFFARTAMGLALALGVAAGSFSAAEAKDKKQEEQAPTYKPTEKFAKAYVAAAKALEAATKRPDVMAQRQKVIAAANAVNSAPNKAGKEAALATFNNEVLALQALVKPEMATVDAAIAAIGNADDKFLAGQLLVNIGNLSIDKQSQLRGLRMQIDSGKVPPASMPEMHATIGQLAMAVKDYPTAQSEIALAIDGGYTTDDPGIDLVDAYVWGGNAAGGVQAIHAMVQKRGGAVPEKWIGYALDVAYKAKLPQDVVNLSADLVTYYPTSRNWASANSYVRLAYHYAGQDRLDLLRLTERTKSFVEAGDYIDYIIYAGPNRLPAEVLKIIDEGLKSGMIDLNASIDGSATNTVAKAQSQAQGRLAEDNSLLAVQEKDARGPKGTAAIATSAGDAYLSHDMPAKAEEMYRLALTKPGVDSGRAQLRLGIALADQAKYPDALQAFSQVTDTRAPIAQLWVAYVHTKQAAK